MFFPVLVDGKLGKDVTAKGTFSNSPAVFNLITYSVACSNYMGSGLVLLVLLHIMFANPQMPLFECVMLQ